MNYDSKIVQLLSAMREHPTFMPVHKNPVMFEELATILE
jgi:hypothetical protein